MREVQYIAHDLQCSGHDAVSADNESSEIHDDFDFVGHATSLHR
jgi:hypothetical protein